MIASPIEVTRKTANMVDDLRDQPTLQRIADTVDDHGCGARDAAPAS